jgi:hypothetical protein
MFPNAGQRQPKLKSRAQARIKKPLTKLPFSKGVLKAT